MLFLKRVENVILFKHYILEVLQYIVMIRINILRIQLLEFNITEILVTCENTTIN